MKGVAVVVSIVAASCGHAASPDAEEPRATAPPSGVDSFMLAPKAEKMARMKKMVMPAMRIAFKEHDEARFSRFNCKTCHGKSCDDETYTMPNPNLPRLDLAALQGGSVDPRTTAIALFMQKTVTPEVARMLGLAVFDPKNPGAGGFGCLNCHVKK